jgi:chromosome segregation ATPase
VDRQVLEYQFQLQRDSIANVRRIEDLAQKQQKLEAEAKTIASRSGALDKRESELEKRVQEAKADIRRIKNNEPAGRWSDGARARLKASGGGFAGCWMKSNGSLAKLKCLSS